MLHQDSGMGITKILKGTGLIIPDFQPKQGNGSQGTWLLIGWIFVVKIRRLSFIRPPASSPALWLSELRMAPGSEWMML